MTTTNIFRVLQLLAYFLVTIQLTYYLYLMGDAMKLVSLDNFYEQRKIVHTLVMKKHQPVYYVCLALSILMIILTIKQPASIVFICSCIAFLCLIADIIIAMKGNGPINNASENYISGAAGNWEAMRLQWLKFINIRGVFSTIGFLSLLTSWVLHKN
jgi:hypothetical protein